MEKKSFIIQAAGKQLHCKRIYSSAQVERYEISFDQKIIVVQNNRPALRKEGKNNHVFKWNLFKGPALMDQDFLINIFKALEYWIKEIDENNAALRAEYMLTKKGENRTNNKGA